MNADCSCDGRRVRHVQAHGDLSFVPAGSESVWEDDAALSVLRLRLHPSILEQVARERAGGAVTLALHPRLQFRDARLEAIGWAIQADLEADAPSDSLYVDHLASALAVRLIETATEARPASASAPKLSTRQWKLLADFIETHFEEQLHLVDLAAVIGVSVTRLKTLFRNHTGMPVHQYVMRRRIEYARALLATTTRPASEIALAAGFAHQSHMSVTMRRLLGYTPRTIARPTRNTGPNLQTAD